ncbi:MAG TPA: hypothetical protein VFH33_06290 [Candidatus Krumholzibacteria bacterium]|nr:hypothetical protein [Candidatus Krumholzibacteria bacterium]
MRRIAFVIVLMFAAVGGASGKNKDYHPVIDPANFSTTVDNPYYPLVPGTVYKFAEHVGKEIADNEITVTHDTKVIMGVTCTVVHDVVLEKGVVTEDTYDWFAQDKDGNVWYFGEDTKEFHSGGKADTEGSWEAGVGPNQPGIIMPAKSVPGEPYRQEYGPGHAEDMGQIMAVHEKVTVPFGAFDDCVRTKEWSLLEAGSEKKWYAKGVGCVKEVSPQGDVTELISVTKPQ